MESYEKKGYLNSEFRIFHLTDLPKEEYEFHYHDFDKIIIFLKGKVRYQVEGKAYQLNPYDIVLVSHNDIHRPEIDPSQEYERIIIYISPNFLKAYKNENYDLSFCFQKAREEKTSVLRMQSLEKSSLYKTMMRLENMLSNTTEYAQELYVQVLFLEFMVLLNRAAKKNRIHYIDTDLCNEKIVDILEYINTHIGEELSIDELAGRFFISKYYMMRLFKEETGYTIGNYISYRRLVLARHLLSLGNPVTKVCFQVGFKDYTTFLRAYKNLFHETPSVAREV